MAKLFLVRHFQSVWNKENRFTGWTDVALSEEGVKQAPEVAKLLAGEKIDEAFTSPLERNKNTTQLILENLGKKMEIQSWDEKADFSDSAVIPTYLTEALNERSYGSLQGKNKDEAKQAVGEEQVFLWRRSWDVAPPAGESLKDVYERAVPFFQTHVEPELKQGKNILVVASHNSLRALVKYLENIKEEEISLLEIPSGGIRGYQVDENLNYTKL